MVSGEGGAGGGGGVGGEGGVQIALIINNHANT